MLHIINFTNNYVLDKNTFEKSDYDLSDHNRGGFQKMVSSRLKSCITLFIV